MIDGAKLIGGNDRQADRRFVATDPSTNIGGDLLSLALADMGLALRT